MSDQYEKEVLALFNLIIKSLCDRPDDASVHTISTTTNTAFMVRCHATDLGKVIGKQGRTARSLRVILDANGMRLKRKFSLDIQECERVGPAS